MFNQIPFKPPSMVLVGLVASLLVSCNAASGNNPAQLSTPFKVLAADKATICHLPPGHPENAQTLSIATSALAAHLEHGDQVGDCAATPSASPTAVATSTPTAEPTSVPVATPTPAATSTSVPATPTPEPTPTSTAPPMLAPPTPPKLPARPMPFPKYVPAKPFLPPARPMYMPRILMPMMTARSMKTVTVRVNVLVRGDFAGFGDFGHDQCSHESVPVNQGPRRMAAHDQSTHDHHRDDDH